MFCSNCGSQIQEGEKFCSNCGTPVVGPEVKRFNPGEMNGNIGQESSYGFEANNSAAGAGTGYSGPYKPIMPLRTDRSILIFVLLSIVTCGIYGLIFLYLLIQDVNTACEGDGEETPGFLLYLLLSVCTCGIYQFIWFYKLGNRLSNNCRRYGFSVSEDGTTVLLWMIFGYFLCGIGPFIAMNIVINQTNNVCMGYNRANGMA